MSQTPTICDCKVGRAIDEYDLSTLNRELERQHENGESLRSLESVVNTRILQGAIRDSDADVVGDATTIYEQLVSDDVDAGLAAEVRQKLVAEGVEVDSVEDRFVSYQTVRHHLQDCLDRDTARDATLTTESATDIIQWSRTRAESIMEKTLNRLDRAGELTMGSVDVTQSVTVTCEDCGATATITEFVRRGGCDCEHDPEGGQ